MYYSYTAVLRDILDAKDWKFSVSSVLRENNPRSGMTMENFLKYASALGARVYVEWEDEGDGRRRYRWEIRGEK